MSVEERMYADGWRYCARCGTRRPQAALDARGECLERPWCEKRLPNCDGCGLPVEQPISQGRPRKRHPECRALAVKMRGVGQ